jgi:long-chain acyl-CoA synthetase
MMAPSQIHRFLILHKELDADDGEMTRTQKVRRNFINERYGELIEALYDGSTKNTSRPKSPSRMAARARSSATVRIADTKTFGTADGAMKEAAE